MKQAKQQSGRTGSAATMPKSKTGRWLLIAALVGVGLLVALWVGVRSQAAGWRNLDYIEAQNVYEDYQDDISYVPLSEAEAIRHARNYQSLCSADIFDHYFERIVEEARVDFEDDIQGRNVSNVCFRVGLSNGNYVYSNYTVSGSVGMGGGPRLYIGELSQDGTPITDQEHKTALKKLVVYSGLPYPEENETSPDIEYVGLEETGEACDIDAFAVEGRQTFSTASGGGQVDLALFGLADIGITEEPAPATYPAVALCFRTRVETEYTYEKYGDVKADIFFQNVVSITEDEENFLHWQVGAYAPLAPTLGYVPIEAGAVCSATVYDAGVLAGLRVERVVSSYSHSPTNEERVSPEPLIVYQKDLAAHHVGLCFKADFGNGNILYKAFEPQIEYVRVKVVWKFEVWTFQYNEDLGVTSSRDIKSWRAVRSDYWQRNETCDDTMFEQQGQLQGAISGLGDSDQDEEFEMAIVRLDGDDVGRLYCIEVTDNEDNKAYATSPIIYRPTPFSLYVIQYNDRLIATTYGGERLGENKPSRLSQDYTTWSIVHQSSNDRCDYDASLLGYEHDLNGSTEIHVSLDAEDYGQYFCFKATRNYRNGETATSYFRILANAPVEDDDEGAVDPQTQTPSDPVDPNPVSNPTPSEDDAL